MISKLENRVAYGFDTMCCSQGLGQIRVNRYGHVSLGSAVFLLQFHSFCFKPNDVILLDKSFSMLKIDLRVKSKCV
jgi:hypothetical protein